MLGDPGTTTEPRSISEGRRHLKHIGAILAVLLIAANLRAPITGVGPLIGTMIEELGLTSFAGSALISLPLLCFAAFSPVVPAISARMGIERLLCISLVVLAAGITIRSLPMLMLLWLGTALVGLSIAALNVTLPAYVKQAFPEKIALITGGYAAVQGAAAAAAAGIAIPLSTRFDAGWRVTLGMWAVLALITAVVVRPALKRMAEKARISLSPGRTPRLRSPWTTALGWQVTLYMGAQSTIFYTMITWWPAIQESYGAAPTVAGFHQSVLQLSGILGSLTTAVLLRRIQKDQRCVAAALTLIPVLGLIGQLLFPELSFFWSAAIGFAATGNLVLAVSLVGLRTRLPSHAAALSGMSNGFGYLLAAAGPITIGLLHDLTGQWTIPILAVVSVGLIQFCAATMASRSRLLPE